MLEKEQKYIDLLLTKCLNFEKSKSLLISYDVINKDFVEKIVRRAKQMGVVDIYLDEQDINITYEKLKNGTINSIETDPYFSKSIWDVYAKNNASFLMIVTEFPKFLDDIPTDLVAKAAYVKRTSCPLYRKLQLTYQIPWCIAAFPNIYWAKYIFKDDSNAYQKLFDKIMEICMVDKEDPIKSWDDYIKQMAVNSEKLNSLQIKKLHYTNSLGTDLTIEMPNNYRFLSASDDTKLKMFVNMPSYEVFSTPNYIKTEGIVYASRPLVYAGALIDQFYLKFKKGKVIDYDAKVGKEVLKEIIESDSNSCYLGEVALVNYDSPISNTGLVFGTTLIDENASCHLALGEGFKDAIEDGMNLSKEALLQLGINQSSQHVDFMIGTSDLKIEAETDNGKVVIFKDGNFNI